MAPRLFQLTTAEAQRTQRKQRTQRVAEKKEKVFFLLCATLRNSAFSAPLR